MKGIAIERLSFKQKVEVYDWLYETFGPDSDETWHEERDYEFVDIVVNDKIYAWYVLRFGL
jgi:hypothetical protein